MKLMLEQAMKQIIISDGKYCYKMYKRYCTEKTVWKNNQTNQIKTLGGLFYRKLWSCKVYDIVDVDVNGSLLQ